MATSWKHRGKSTYNDAHNRTHTVTPCTPKATSYSSDLCSTSQQLSTVELHSQHSDLCTCLVKWSLQQLELAVIWSGSRSIVRYWFCVLRGRHGQQAHTHASRQNANLTTSAFPHPNKRQRLAEAIEGIHHQLFFAVVHLVNTYKFLQGRFCGEASCGVCT